ncbi:MAG: alpha-2-macroglobulin, partial [Phycisphaerae bacterium]|nr:alpha-2-macroglobulin [Phycisphaerae bacterium]
MKARRIASFAVVLLAASAFILVADEPASWAEQYDRAAKLEADGNYNDAYKIYSDLALGNALDAEKTASSLLRAIRCLRHLNRRNEIDAFREKVIAAHPESWRVLKTAARTLWHGQHWGFMVAGEFERGHHRGGGQRVGSFERDRVRALQLMVRAMDPMAEAGPGEKQAFWRAMERYLMGYRGWREAWRLQYLTDLSELPDYEENYYGWYRGGSNRGAPVDEEGNPIYYYRPKTWDDAANDGERWRYALAMVTEYGQTSYATSRLAQFCYRQFGVQTLRQYGHFFGRNWGMDEDSTGQADDTGTWELHTLKDTETIARLATGPKRFTLPDEFNFIRILRERGNDNQLATIYMNRRQYGRAGELYETLIGRHSREEVRQHLSEKDWMWLPDPKHNNGYWQQLRQVMGNVGQFEPIMLQPAGQGASVEFRFRNGKEVTFTAHAVKIEELLEDAKAYIKSNPSNKKWDWRQMDIGRIGHRLVNENQQKYIGEQVAEWTLELEPRADHFDKRITVNTPLQTAGAYLLTAKMAGGNTCNVIIWLADTAIVHKPLSEQRQWYFVTDAVTGEPVEKMNVEFFGWRRHVEYRRNRPNKVETFIKQFAEHTDADGQVILGGDQMPNNHQWVAIARDEKGRLAYLGWQGIWGATHHDSQYHAVRSFVMTDRPVYRPGQSAKVHFWVNTAKYDIDGESEFAGRKFTMDIRNPRGETVKEIPVTLDTYGGAGGEFTLGEEPPLGVWSVQLWQGAKGHVGRGAGSFRVEEYRKPEYEVTIEAPSEPVALGETIEATVKAEYYFGGPVQNAKVHYKVTRSEHDARWYPAMPWDWLYGGGYWWFAYDYTWYPGWSEWGCRRPYWPWWGWRPTPQPELVADAEAEIGEDGTLKIKIDTALAKAIHGDRDHRYSITAEVRDASRRTIIGSGEVLVARKPFKVYSWTDRGHYRVGDTVEASFQARRIDGKGVEAKGELRLMKVTYKDGRPVEEAVQTWKLPTDESGRASQKIDAAQPGQYRLSYTVTDAKGHDIEGGYVFMIWGEGVTGSEFRYNALELTPEKTSYDPGETVNLRINRNRAGGAVALFDRPTGGVYLPPTIIRLKGKSITETIEVAKRDMPNFFIEAVTVADGEAHSVARQIVVPPVKRILDMTVTTDKDTYKPGETGKVTVTLRDETGEPFVGNVVLTLYDKAVEYISGGSNVGDIKEIYWGWKRSHHPNQQTSLQKSSRNLVADARRDALSYLGIFGYSAADEPGPDDDGYAKEKLPTRSNRRQRGLQVVLGPMRKDAVAEPAPSREPMGAKDKLAEAEAAPGGGGGDGMAETTVRTQFADTALWRGDIVTDKDGTATIELTMPENLTTWKARAWAMGHGTRVGEASAEAITTKD